MSERFGSFLGRVADRRLERNVAVVMAFLYFSILQVGVSWLARSSALPPWERSVLEGGLTGAIFGCMVGVILRAWCERRAFVRDELRRVAELNHNMRNALEIIASAHYFHPQEQAGVIQESVALIDATLQTLFPALDQRHRSTAVRNERRTRE